MSEYSSCPLKRRHAHLDAVTRTESAGTILVPIQIKFVVSNGGGLSPDVSPSTLARRVARH
jgi:hypothetical protein